MTILAMKRVQGTVLVLVLALALVPLAWLANLWVKRHALQADFDRIQMARCSTAC